MNIPGTVSLDKEENGDATTDNSLDTPPTSQSGTGHVYQTDGRSLATRLGITPESFKRRTGADKHNQLNQTLRTRHLHMIAIGGSIGAGLFVGSGGALSTGGPGALLIAFSIIGVMIFNVVYALGELAVMYPISGGFYTYSARFIDPAWGFAMGWNYVCQWAIVLPLEIVVAGLTVSYWPNDVNIAVWITVFWLVIILISVLGVMGYAEEEFWVALLKLCTIVIFMVIALVFVCGGGPSDGPYGSYLGARYWRDPGAFADGFLGVCRVFVTAAFAFSGTELVGLAAAESKTPQKSLPGAIKQVFWRITLFYILALLFVGLLVPYNNPRLLGSGLIDVQASPFVIAAELGGIPAFGSFVNVVILMSVVSIGLSGVYGGSRTLTALSEQGYAPKAFAYVDRAGRPLASTIFILAFGGIAYISLASGFEVVFNWLLALSGLAALFTWGSICLAHIRFRSAWKYHGHSVEELPFKAVFGVWGSWVGLALIVLVLIAQFAVAVIDSLPQNNCAIFNADGTEAADGAEVGVDGVYETCSSTPSNFFQAYLAFFVVIVFYVVGWLMKRKAWMSLSEIDVDGGRRAIDEQSFYEEKQKRAAWPKWRRALDKIV